MVRVPSRHLFVLGVMALLIHLSVAHAGEQIPARVERVADGDTVTAYTANHTKLRIRLLGIDAPEIRHGAQPGQPFGEDAKAYLTKMVRGQQTQVHVYGLDRYHRILAILYQGNRIVNVEVVRAGLAEVYRGARCQALCRDLEDAEREAKQRRVGMWSQGSSYESPASFRHRLRRGGG